MIITDISVLVQTDKKNETRYLYLDEVSKEKLITLIENGVYSEDGRVRVSHESIEEMLGVNDVE